MIKVHCLRTAITLSEKHFGRLDVHSPVFQKRKQKGFLHCPQLEDVGIGFGTQ
jgi:hypothetical protein